MPTGPRSAHPCSRTSPETGRTAPRRRRRAGSGWRRRAHRWHHSRVGSRGLHRRDAREEEEATRASAAERRAATDATYSGIKQKIAELRKEATPFLTDLKDIRQYLKSDLSKEGLRTMEPTAQRVFDQKDNIIKRLDDVIQGLDGAIKGL